MSKQRINSHYTGKQREPGTDDWGTVAQKLNKEGKSGDILLLSL